ncbi:peptidase S10 [Novosphingobium sp. AAP1]|uniref:S10 family peptidase n=1 Tax=unclassified Novosphingobium TaxID=2644732 RepID=UPI0003B3B449|nr:MULTISPECIES: peptidase S10 [unclassified Novosphingobium]KPF53439.1 peptidase S10 [Novosphingobium sp. AAP1]
MRALLLPLILASAAAPLHAQPASPAPAQTARHALAAPVITHHKGTFGGQTLAYTAQVEATEVKTVDGAARLVSFAYLRDGANPATRPVLFAFNGGPIVASAYVHVGGLGPRRATFPDDIAADPAKVTLADNPASPLDAADLVFVDPASTGFSTVAPGTDPHAFWSVRADAAQVAAFIRAWLAAHGRTGAPVYVLGESYGTNRACEIARQLAQGPDPLPLAGVVLYGQAANIIEYAQRPANVTSYVASLPTLAAIAWYHGRADRQDPAFRGMDLPAFLAAARAFAKGDYLTVLYQGSGAPLADRARVAARLAAFTGIPAAWYLAHDLRISKERYRVELLKDKGLVLGRMDARYTMAAPAQGGAPDASEAITDTLARLFERYRHDELKVAETQPYVLSAPVEGFDQWGWGSGTSPFADWPYYQGITAMMAANPRFQVLVANGYYDTQTTMGGAELLATQSGWDPQRVTLRYYDGGHTGYSVAATAQALGNDIRMLISKTAPAQTGQAPR